MKLASVVPLKVFKIPNQVVEILSKQFADPAAGNRSNGKTRDAAAADPAIPIRAQVNLSGSESDFQIL